MVEKKIMKWSKKFFIPKGGGTLKVHVVFRGGIQNVHVWLLGGEGGVKILKKMATWFVYAAYLYLV